MARLIHDEVQLSIFGVIFVKFSLIYATLFNRYDGRVITVKGKVGQWRQQLSCFLKLTWTCPLLIRSSTTDSPGIHRQHCLPSPCHMSCSLSCWCCCFELCHLSDSLHCCVANATVPCCFRYYCLSIVHWLATRFVCWWDRLWVLRSSGSCCRPPGSLALCWSWTKYRQWQEDLEKWSDLPVVIITISIPWSHERNFVHVWRSHATVDSIWRMCTDSTDSHLFRRRLEILIVAQVAAVHVVVRVEWRLRWGPLDCRRWRAVVLTIWTLTRCGWWAAVAWEWRRKVLWFAPGKFLNGIFEGINKKFLWEFWQILTVSTSIDPARCKMASPRGHRSIYVDAVRRHYHVCTKLFLIRLEWQICRGP